MVTFVYNAWMVALDVGRMNSDKECMKFSSAIKIILIISKIYAEANLKIT